MTEPRYDAPPLGEEVHLPGPTLLPLMAAVALTLIVVGTTLTFILSVAGLVILVWVAIRWIRDTREDLAELPDRHH